MLSLLQDLERRAKLQSAIKQRPASLDTLAKQKVQPQQASVGKSPLDKVQPPAGGKKAWGKSNRGGGRGRGRKQTAQQSKTTVASKPQQSS